MFASKTQRSTNMKGKYALWMAVIALTLVGCSSQPATAPETSTQTTLATDQAPDSPSGTQANDVESSEAENEENVLPATDAESGWASTYQGRLDGKIEASLVLHGLGDVVRGTITYKKSGKPIMVLGHMNTDGTFFLRELQPDGNITGVMSGTEKSKKLTGTWYAPGTDKELGLDMDVLTVQEEGSVTWPYPAKSIAGEYRYHYGKEGPSGSLGVEQAGSKVKVAFDCNHGAPGYNMAMVEETEIALNGNEARYKMPEMDCEFRIQFFDGFAMVGYVDEQYDCGFGHNASIEGEFVKVK